MRALVLLACLALGGCAGTVTGNPSPPAGSAGGPSQGRELSPGVEVVEKIPPDLPASGRPRIDHDDVCGSIPAAAVAELGYGEPHDSWFSFCQWLVTRSGHHFVNVGYDERPMAVVAEQTSPATLSHLRTLRINGHWAIEAILAYDPMQSCSVWADYGASETLLVTTYTGLEIPTREAVGPLCAESRRAVTAVLRQLDGS